MEQRTWQRTQQRSQLWGLKAILPHQKGRRLLAVIGIAATEILTQQILTGPTRQPSQGCWLNLSGEGNVPGLVGCLVAQLA